MARAFFSNLRLRRWLFIIGFLTLALGPALYCAEEQRRRAIRGVQEQALRMVQIISSDEERLIEGTRHLLSVLSHVPDVRDRDPDACSQFLSSLLKDNPLYANFGLINRAGDVICSAVPIDEPVNLADRQYFLGAVVARDFATGEFQVERITEKASISFGYPIFDADDRLQAVVFAAIGLSWLNHLVAAAGLPEGTLLLVIDRNGTILARYPQLQPGVGKLMRSNPLFQAMLAGGQDTAELREFDDVPRIFAATGLRGLPEAAYVSVGIPKALAYAPVRQALVNTLVKSFSIGWAAPFIQTASYLQPVLKKPSSWPIAALGSGIIMYVLGLIALLLLASRRGSTIFSRTWLSAVAAKPLLITPRLGAWALFLGYTRRLGNLRAIGQAASGYFGLPAEDSTGSIVLPDVTGESLHERIRQVLGPQQPVVILGKGGSGKSTLLARWAFLALEGRLPSLKNFRPVLITASYYENNLVKAVADILRERDGVAVDEKMVQAQLQAGKFLILFDGVSEVEADRQHSLREILRAAQSADFRGCRFLIATRPLENMSEGLQVFHLRPLTPDVISVLLPRYGLGRARESQVRRQLQSFGEKPLEPLLFAMAMAQSGTEQVSATRAQLYDRYFRRLMRVEANDMAWRGWRRLLETLAGWFLLDTGRRGIGLPHEQLLDLIMGKADDGRAAESLLKRLQDFYHLPVNDPLTLLQQVEAAGILQGERRWRFAHDTFEEYFAASYLVSSFEEKEQWPILDRWLSVHEREHEFLEILNFVGEMIDEATRQRILKLDLRYLWKDRLQETVVDRSDDTE